MATVLTNALAVPVALMPSPLAPLGHQVLCIPEGGGGGEAPRTVGGRVVVTGDFRPGEPDETLYKIPLIVQFQNQAHIWNPHGTGQIHF